MKMLKIFRKRRAVSPVLAAILLIGLAVAAGAVLFVVIMPMIESSGEFDFSSVKFSNLNTTNDGGSDAYDKAKFTLTNEGSKTVAVTAITIEGYNDSWVPVNESSPATTTFPFSITTSQSEIDITYTFADHMTDFTLLRIRVVYKIGDIEQDPLLSSEYAAFES